MAIVDQFGNPLQRETLTTPQTAKLAARKREFAGHPSRGLTPAKMASILDAAEQGDIVQQHELFTDMEEKDAHIYAEMAKRKRAILTVPWSIAPPRNASAAEKSLATELEELLRDIPNFEDVLLDLMDGVGHGFSNLEIEWERIGKDWMPKAINHRPQTWFQLDRDTRTELRLRDDTTNGAALNPFGWIQHVHRAKSGYIARAGLCRVLSWPYLFKNYSVRDLAEFLEIYGLPLRIGKYPSGASDKEKSTLLAAVVGIGHNAAGIMPESMAIEIQEAAKGSEGPFLAMNSWAESSVSKAVLGGTLTSQADGKSSTNALGNVHNEVRHDILEADARQIASTLTGTLLHYLLALNKGGVPDTRRMPRFEFDTSEPEDLALYADALPKLAAVGAQIPVNWVGERLRIPAPKEGEAVLGAGPQAILTAQTGQVFETCPVSHAVPNAQTGQVSKTCPVSHAVLAATIETDPTPIDPLTQAMSDQTATAWRGILEQVRAMVDTADSLESLRDMLLNAYGALDTAELARIMQLGFSVANLAGRYDLESESKNG